MKFTTTALASLALTPFATARRSYNSYGGNPVRRDPSDSHLLGRHNKWQNGFYGGSGSGSSSSVNVNVVQEVIVIWAFPGGSNAQTTTVNDKVTVTSVVTVNGGGGQATSVAAAAIASHTVTVGGDAGLVYTPPSLENIPVGDMIVFEFLSQNHTVTQSGFDTPCVKLDGGMDSDFQPNPNNTVSPPPQVAMQVMSTDPLWFYCRQEGHCGMGMVFSVNPTADKTQGQFQQAAIAQNGTDASSPVVGGNAAASSSTGSSSGSSSTNIASGQGSIGSDGSCTCFASCSAGGFPVAAQGVGAFGGVAGSVPLSMASMS